MSRVQLVQEDKALPEAKEIYEKLEKHGARVLNLYRVLAHSPEVMRNFMRLANSLFVGVELSPKLRELAILRIARITGSEYEWTQHYLIALEVGVSHEQTEALSGWSDSTCFSDEERAMLQYTDEVAQNVVVKDQTFEALRKHLSERSIVELTLSIGYWGMVARLLVPLQVEIDAQSVGSAKELIGRGR